MDAGWVSLLALVHFVAATLSVYHILLYKRDPRSAVGWIMACVIIPYGGPITYFLFGINRVRSRARDIRRRFFTIEYESGRAKSPTTTDIPHGITSAGLRVSGRTMSTGNSVEVLHNGEQAYPAMLASINAAKNRILLATFILKADRTGTELADALSGAVDRGVAVMVLVDGIGEMYSWRRPSTILRKRKISVARFLPPKLFPPSVYVNLRNHRKLLVVDDDVAYAGGMNISDEHTSAEGETRKVTDVHFALRGPVVAELAELFCHDWHSTTGDRIPTDHYSGQHDVGAAGCRVIPDGPDEELDALALTIQAVISAAAETILIMTPYFLPSRELIASLQSAAMRGVRVQIVLPGKNNLFYVNWANRNILSELIQWGIEICYQPAPFNHSKILCIDDDYCMIGSANLDPRSLRLNFELGIEVFSRELNIELRTHVEGVIARSTPITLVELANRSIPIRLRDSFASLFSPYI